MMRKLLIGLVVLLAISNIVWFWPANLYFLNDDLLHIPLTDRGSFFQTNSVRPLHELLVKLDLLVWKKQAAGFHLTALLLHFVVCVQLYYFCIALQTGLFKTKPSTEAALLSVALFLAYPQSSESIAWILGRTPVLSAIFFLLSLQLFLRQKISAGTCVLGALAFGATLFTYEQSILFPLCLMWLARLESDELLRRRRTAYVLTLFLVAGVYLIVRRMITAQVVGNYEGGNFIAMNVPALFGNFFRLFSRLFLNPASIPTYLVAFAALATVGTLAVYKWRNRLVTPTPVFFGLAILLLLFPVVSLGIAINSYESGRYLYLPAIFLVIAVAIALTRCYQLRGRTAAYIVVFVIGYWLYGKCIAACHYAHASQYAGQVMMQVDLHFKQSSKPLIIDTLNESINRLPVFRLGFKEGVNWLYPGVDTNKIMVLHRFDEATAMKKE